MNTALAVARESESGTKRRLRERVRVEFEALRASGKRFGVLTSEWDEDFGDFIEIVCDIANAESPPPYLIAPYYGEGRGRSFHETAVARGVIITF